MVCCGVVCRCGVCSRFSWVRPRFGRSPRLPPPPDPLSRLLLRRTTQNFAILFLPLLGVFSWNFGGVIEEPGPSNVHVWALGLSCETPAAFAKCQEQFYNFSPPLPMTSEKVNDQLLQILLVSRKKSLEHTENPREHAPPPSGPTPRGPHFFWVVVCAVCVAPDSAACCCFSCCLCSCCGLLLPLLLLLLVLVAAFGPPTVEPPPSTFAVFDLPKCYNNFSNWDKICRYPTEFPREDTPPVLPSLPPTTLRAPHLLALIVLGLAPRIRASLMLLLCDKNTLAAFNLPKCLYCFVALCAVFAIFCGCLMLAFLVVCCFSCCSCCFCRFCGSLLFVALLLLLLLPVVATAMLLLLLLLLQFLLLCWCCCCGCFQVADRWNATVWYCLCCCCLCGLLFVVFLLLLLFWFCLHCFAFFFCFLCCFCFFMLLLPLLTF